MVQQQTESAPFAKEKYHHVGVIVRDIEQTIAHLSSIGIGPFQMPDGSPYVEITFTGELHGKPSTWKVKISNAKIGDGELELLEPCGGESALQEYLDNHGEGIHHIGYVVDDVGAEVEKLKERGVGILTSAISEKGGFAYFDTGTVGGIVIEIRTL